MLEERMPFEQLLFLFQSGHAAIDETSFFFSDDPEKEEHFIGFLPQQERPYWVGLCDIEGGCDFLSAEDLFSAKVFDGRSLHDRRKNVVLLQIGGLGVDDWMKQ